MTPEQQAALQALGQFHAEPETQTTAEQLLEAADQFVKPDGTFDANAYFDQLNFQP